MFIDNLTDRLIDESGVSHIENEMKDKIADEILKIINGSKTPLETKEISEQLKNGMGDISRSKLIYRLGNLRGDGEIFGKSVGSGKGVWIWWKVENDK
jgi:repressor of nif and glnA expression